MKNAVTKNSTSTCQSSRIPEIANNGMSHTTYHAWMMGASSTNAASAHASRRNSLASRPTNISTTTTAAESTVPAVCTASIHAEPLNPHELPTSCANNPSSPIGAYQMYTVPGVETAETHPKPKPLTNPMSANKATE